MDKARMLIWTQIAYNSYEINIILLKWELVWQGYLLYDIIQKVRVILLGNNKKFVSEMINLLKSYEYNGDIS